MQNEFDALIAQHTRAKVQQYRELNLLAKKGQTVLVGSSQMENFPVGEMLMNRRSPKIVYNRSLSALTIDQYASYLDCVLELQPSKLFVNIGSADLSLPGDTVGNLIAAYRRLLCRVMAELPICRITLLAYYPCRKEAAMPLPEGRIPWTSELIEQTNAAVEKLAMELGLGFMNLNAAVSDREGYLDTSIALDDVHFSPLGYERVLNLLERYL